MRTTTRMVPRSDARRRRVPPQPARISAAPAVESAVRSARRPALRGAGRSQALAAGHADRVLLAALWLLLAISVLMVFSTTAVISQEYYGDSLWMLKRHLLHIGLGVAAFAFFARLDPLRLYSLAAPLLLLTLLLLLAVLVPGIGHEAGGARRWIGYGSLRMQPGEVCKILIIIYFAAYLHTHRRRMQELVAGALVPFGLIGVLGVLLLLEPDFGSTAVITLVVLCQLFMACKLRHLLLLGLTAASAAVCLIATSPYRMRRLSAFLHPFEDPASSGYQLIQSLIAVGSGGTFGVGLGSGKQKLFYLPAAHTDFIFAVIAEELGMVGAMTVLALFLVILCRGLRIARAHAEVPFLSSLAVGCTLLIVLPAFLNAGVVLGLLPTKGMVLPLIAYGGTAMIVHLAAMGILVKLSALES